MGKKKGEHHNLFDKVFINFIVDTENDRTTRNWANNSIYIKVK